MLSGASADPSARRTGGAPDARDAPPAIYRARAAPSTAIPRAPMRRLTLGLALAVLGVAAAPAAAQYAEGSARHLALGRAGVAVGAEAWGHANPAAWAPLAERRVALQGSQAFGLSEVRLAAVSAAAPTAAGTVALSARTFGFAEHRETRVVAGFARPLPLSRARRLDAGVSVGYESAATEGYGSVGSVLVGLGVQGEVLPRLRAGLAARNVTGLLRSAEDDLRRSAATVPGVAVGLAYAASDRALVVLDADQDLDFGLSLRGGAEVRPVEMLALRVGAASNPQRLTAGAGVAAGRLRADLAVDLHETLGLTPSFGVEIGF